MEGHHRYGPDQLSPREREVVVLMAKGLTNAQIAELLGITFYTAKSHVSAVITKLETQSREDAVRKWRESQRIRARFSRTMRALVASVSLGKLGIGAGGVATVAGAAAVGAMWLGYGEGGRDELGADACESYQVDGNGMYPTLEDGQVILISVEQRQPRRGDIVVFRDPGRPDRDLIKRVVGLPGETAEIREGSVFIDDLLMEEPHVVVDWHDTRPKIVIPEGRYYVLGDNRNSSLDSRSTQVGLVPALNIMGTFRQAGECDTETASACPVTVPAEPFLAPAPYPSEPPARYESVWYGTGDLWTMLKPEGETWRGLPKQDDGALVQKTFWWSRRFVVAEEPQPLITVSGRRLDAPGVTFTVEHPGTHAIADFGTAMLVGIAVPTMGCWEIRAAYKGAELTYVVRIEAD